MTTNNNNNNNDNDKQQEEGIPIIDLSEDDDVVGSKLVDAFRTMGFATLIHHGVDNELFQSAFGASKSFFCDLSEETKLQYKYKGHASNRGYIGVGKEKFESNTMADRKETYDIGKEGEDGMETPWPSELKEEDFRGPLLTYFETLDKVYLRLMKLVGRGLGLKDENFLADNSNEQHANLRLLHYPEVDRASLMGVDSDVNHDIVYRGARHTDYGTLTLLIQDMTGGLQVQRLDGRWTYVPPVEESIVVNVGDMLQRWTNDVLRATPHQVINMPSHTSVIPERFSIAFFFNANKSVMLDCIEGVSDEEPKYAPINAHEYITSRLAATIKG